MREKGGPISVLRRIQYMAMAMAVLGGSVVALSPARATEAFASGACTIDVTVELTGTDLWVDPVAPGSCMTVDGEATGEFGAVAFGVVGFVCSNGTLVGSGDGFAGLTVLLDDDVYLGTTSMPVLAAVGEGPVIHMDFEWHEAAQVIAGTAMFVPKPGTTSVCSGGPDPSVWTGSVVFVDPVLPV